MFELSAIDLILLILVTIALVVSFVAWQAVRSLELFASKLLDRDSIDRSMGQSARVPQSAPGQYAQITGSSQQSDKISARVETPSLPPQAIAPSLKKPPRPKGGFGSKSDSGPKATGNSQEKQSDLDGKVERKSEQTESRQNESQETD